MVEIPGAKVIQARKRDLLLTSNLNRQVLQLELEQIRLRAEQFKQGWLHNSWKWVVPIAGFLAARKFKKSAGFFAQGSLGLFLLRKLWEKFRSP